MFYDNFSKTDSEKIEEIHNRDTKYYIENMRLNFPIYIIKPR